MLKVKNIDVWGFEHAIRGMRNPLNSWDKSDSHTVYDSDLYFTDVEIGKNDLGLAERLINAGAEHSKFLRQIFVSMDITAPLYWWKEMDQYKVGTTTDSCSTMHKIASKEFTLDDFSHEHLQEPMLDVLKSTIDALNHARDAYLSSKDKLMWWQMIQLLPSSYNQMRTWTGSYANLRNIYHQRKNHKLDEWKYDFCNVLKELPHSKTMIIN